MDSSCTKPRARLLPILLLPHLGWDHYQRVKVAPTAMKIDRPGMPGIESCHQIAQRCMVQ